MTIVEIQRNWYFSQVALKNAGRNLNTIAKVSCKRINIFLHSFRTMSSFSLHICYYTAFNYKCHMHKFKKIGILFQSELIMKHEQLISGH